MQGELLLFSELEALKAAWCSGASQRMYGSTVFCGGADCSQRLCRRNVTVTRQQAWARIVSRSYLAILPEEKLAEIKATFESVLDANKDKFHSPSGSIGSDADSEVAEIPLRLEVFIARKR